MSSVLRSPVSTNNLWTLKKKTTLHRNHTLAKSTLSHFVPLVNALKEAMPLRALEGVPRNAIQFTTADPFVPRPDSSTQMRKLFCVTSVVQTTAESCTLSDSFSWLMDARTRMLLELENTWGYCTVLQWSKLGDTTMKLTFPCCRRLCPESGNCWEVGNGTISEVEWRTVHFGSFTSYFLQSGSSACF